MLAAVFIDKSHRFFKLQEILHLQQISLNFRYFIPINNESTHLDGFGTVCYHLKHPACLNLAAAFFGRCE